MPYINRATIQGHLGQDAEVKYMFSGRAVSNLSIATNRRWKTKDGKDDQHTEWHRITIWGPRAEWTHEWKKGDLVQVEGRIETREWKDRDGQDRTTAEIIAEDFGMLANLSHKNPNSRSNPRESETVPDRDALGRQIGWDEEEKPLPAHVTAGDGTDDLPF